MTERQNTDLALHCIIEKYVKSFRITFRNSITKQSYARRNANVLIKLTANNGQVLGRWG